MNTNNIARCILHIHDFRRLCASFFPLRTRAGFSVGSACAWTLLTVQAQMLEPCGYTTLEVGYSSTALLG